MECCALKGCVFGVLCFEELRFGVLCFERLRLWGAVR